MTARIFAGCVLSLAAVLVHVSIADACTCVGPINTCSAISSAAAVFDGTVASVRVGPTAPPEAGSMTITGSDVRIVTFRNVTAWRGAAPTSVRTALHGSACGYEFKVGTRYLVVAEASAGGHLAVTRCGLTRPFSEATGLVDYLRLPVETGTKPPVRIWGQVTRASRWTDFAREHTGVPQARVVIDGPVRQSIRTDADGRFLLDDLPPGRYSATVLPPATLPLGQAASREFELGTTAATACLELDFVAPIDSSISGVVVDAAGAPLAGAFVRLQLLDQRDFSRGAAGAGATTDAQGSYRFTDLPPGRYSIGVGASSDEAAAREVSLRLGQRIVLQPFISPKR